jgi:hypothetical protein
VGNTESKIRVALNDPNSFTFQDRDEKRLVERLLSAAAFYRTEYVLTDIQIKPGGVGFFGTAFYRVLEASEWQTERQKSVKRIPRNRQRRRR